MKTLLLSLLTLCLPAWATVECSGGGASWSGTTCTGGSRPYTYTITSATSTLSLTDVQNATNDMCLGDTVVMEAGKILKLTQNQTWTVKKVPASCSTTGYRTFTTSEAAKLPNDGTRITPAYAPLTVYVEKDPTNISPFTSANAISAPWMFIYGGKRYLAEHVKLRGITFRTTPLADRANGDTTAPTASGVPASNTRFHKVSTAYIQVGKDICCNKDSSTGPPFYSSTWAETALSSSTLVGATSIPVTDVTGIEAGMVLAILDSTAGEDWVVVDSVDSGTNTITSSRAMSFAHASGRAVSQQVTDPSRDMPDDLVIQHCMFISDHVLMMNYGVYMDMREMTVKDSHFEGFRGVNPTDSRALLGSNGIGPIHLINNYIDGAGENMMQGGTQPTGDWEPGRDATQNHMYNYFPKHPEEYQLGKWTDAVIPSTSQPTGPWGIDRLVLKGKCVIPSTASLSTAKVWCAVQSGVASTTEPTWPASPTVGDTITDGGVTWKHAGTNGNNYYPFIKNNYEIKAGSNLRVQYNVFDHFPDNEGWNGVQPNIVNIKATSAGCGTGGAAPNAWPLCYAARVKNVLFANNKLITQRGGINLGSSSGQWAAVDGARDWILRDNIIIATALGVSATSTSMAGLRIGAASATDVVTNIEIMHNTWYNTLNPTTGDVMPNVSTTASLAGDVFPGTNKLIGNIWAAWAYSYRNSHATQGSNDGGTSLQIFPCNGQTYDQCDLTKFDKNILNGAFTTNKYRAGTVLNNCSGTGSCAQPTAWDFLATSTNTGIAIPAANRVRMFRNRTGVSVRNGIQGLKLHYNHIWKNGVEDGKDPGADPSQVPDIIGLTVTPTDRMVLFQWRMTPVMDTNVLTGATMPCVVEVWGGDYQPPPFSNASYAGELSQISTYYRQDADNADRFIRKGLERMMVVGHTVNLSPETLYGYRLQCAGDAKVGFFTTTATLAGTQSMPVAKWASHASTQSVQVEYGTYSAATDSIPSASTASADCTTGNKCEVTLPSLTKGTTITYRFLEKSSTGGGGTTLVAGPFRTLVVQ